MKKPISLTLLSVAALLGLAACSSNEVSSSNASSKEDSNSSVASSSTNTSEAPVLEVSVSIVAPTKNTIAVGDELQLQAQVENAKPGDTLTWKSSNNDVLSVDNTGKIRGVSKGEAQITASISGKTSEPITITVEAKIDSTAYPRFLELLTKAEAKDASKVSSLTLSVQNDEYHYQQNKDTKEWENVINRSNGTTWNASFYTDSKTSIETIETDKGENDIKTLHQYGIAHNRLVDVVSDFSNDKYTVNDQKSSSKEITDLEETNTFLNKGEFSKKIGALRYVLDNYFDGTSKFSSIEARRNASLEEKDGAYTLNTSEIVKDDVDNNVHMEYSMTIKLNAEGYLSSLSSHIKSYDSETDGSKRRLTFDTGVTLEETIGARESMDLDLDKFFFKNKSDLIVFLGANPYANQPITSFELNQKYFVIVQKNGTGSTNIDPLTFVSATKDGQAAPEDSYILDDNALTIKKAGSFVFNYKTTLLSDFKIEVEIENHEITSLEFSPKPSFATTRVKDKTYLSENIIVGDTPFTLAANDGADDDTTIEFVTNEIGATVTKDASSPFSYTLHTTKPGKISLKAKSASGLETEVKEVNVFAYTDEGITSYLTKAKWNALNASFPYQTAEFTLKEGSTTAGTFILVNTAGSKITGNFEVKDQAVSLKNAKGETVRAAIVLSQGTNGIYLGMSSSMAYLMLN